MSRTSRSQISHIAVFASGVMLLLGGSALAQPVSVFDDAPSIEQLRSIMIPAAPAGTSRSIVMQRPDIETSSPPVQTVSTQEPTAVRRSAAKAKTYAAPVVQAAAKVSAPEPAAEAGAVAFHVNFSFGSAAMPESAREMIDRMAQLMKETPDIRVRVEGHTDAVGSVGYNVTLSERRAMSVGEYLVKQGVEPSRLELVGKGMAEPITQNKFDAANRRVQFVRIS